MAKNNKKELISSGGKSVLELMLKTGIEAETVDNSVVLNEYNTVPTDFPLFNIALSGDPMVGFGYGITLICGQSRSFKTCVGLFAMASYLKTHEAATCIFYDTELGASTKYFKSFGIDTSRVVHIPISTLEDLKIDFVKKLAVLKRGQKVFFFLDSYGNIASDKEISDALDGKSTTDMTRAKVGKSFFRSIMVDLAIRDLPFFAINHVYKSLDLYPKDIVSGGQGVFLNSGTIIIVTRTQEKDPVNGLTGWNFKLTIEKSRNVKEKTALSFLVDNESGIKLYSGLLEVALEIGAIISPSKGWYALVDLESGIISEQKFRASETKKKSFWSDIIKNEAFRAACRKRYCLSENLINDEDDSFEGSLSDEDSDISEDIEV